MDSSVFVEVTPDPLQITKYVGLVEDNGSGAIATFMGVTRDNFDGKRVLSLSYEAYIPMAEKEMQVSAFDQASRCGFLWAADIFT